MMKYIIVIIYDRMVNTKRYRKNLTKCGLTTRHNPKNMGRRRTKKMVGGMTDAEFTEKFIAAIKEFNSSSKIFIKAQRKEKIRKLLSDFYIQIGLDEHSGFKDKSDNLIRSVTYSIPNDKDKLLELNTEVELKIKAEKDKEYLERTRLETERLEAERLEAERVDSERLEAKRLTDKRLEAERLINAEKLAKVMAEEEKIAEAKRISHEAKRIADEEKRIADEEKQKSDEAKRIAEEEKRLKIETAQLEERTAKIQEKMDKKQTKKQEKKILKELEAKRIADTREIISSTIRALTVKPIVKQIAIYENEAEIIAFWEKIMGRANVKWFMEYFRNTLYFMSTGEIPCNIQSNIASYSTSAPEYDHILCASMYFISKLTELIRHKYLIVLKGGKAVQLVCPIRYISNDIDLVIIKNMEGLEHSTETMAIEISKLYIWCLTYNRSVKKNNISAIQIEQKEPIIKISLREPDKPFTPLIDISYKELSPEIDSINGGRFLRILNEGGTFGFFLSSDINALIDERLYYLIKYFSGTYSVDDNLDYYVLKIEKSLKHLLSCISNGRNTSVNTLYINTQITRLFSFIDPIVRHYSTDNYMAVLDKEIDAFDEKNAEIINELLNSHTRRLIPSKQDEIKQKFRDFHKAKLRLKHTLEISNPELRSETTVKVMEFTEK